jgi:hypothetical protein
MRLYFMYANLETALMKLLSNLSVGHAEHVAHQARDRGISFGPFNEASEMPQLRSA